MDELNRLIKVRAAALGRFSEKNIPPGAPMATLEKVLVPVYLMHRFQAEAVTKLVGGVNYTYAARGDGQPTNDPLPPEQQRAALAALCQTLRPDFLGLPPKLIALIPPAPPGYARDRESFDSHSGMVLTPRPLPKAGSTRNLTSCLMQSGCRVSSRKTRTRQRLFR